MASSGVLTSPNYPDNYNNGIESCVFIISQPIGTVINLIVDDFRLEDGGELCPYDECSNLVRWEVGEVGELEIRGDELFKLKIR